MPFPRQDAPANFLVIRIGSQFSFCAMYDLNVVPSGKFSSPDLK